MKPINNKKAIFYTLAVIVFLGVMLIVFYTYKSYSLRDKQESIFVRVNAMNDFISSFHNDVHRATKISATRAMLSIEDYISLQSKYFNNITELNEFFREVFYYGTINGTEIILMNDTSFQDYEKKVSASARNIGMDFYINVTSISLSQEDPWNILVVINASILLNDSSKLAYWEYNESFKTLVSIEGLRDPLYSVNTNGKIQNIIRRTNTIFFVMNNNTTLLLDHIYNGLYINSSDAPSFLMRFYNNLSPSENGIESLVNIMDLNAQNILIKEANSIVDYKYFYNGVANVCNVQNMPYWFKLQLTDITKYNVNLLNYTGC